MHIRVDLLIHDPLDRSTLSLMDTPTGSPTESPASVTRLVARTMWWNHCVLVVLLVGFVLLRGISPTPDADIGRGLGLMSLEILGMPWTSSSMARFADQLPGLDDRAWVAASSGGAVLNVVLHAALLTVWDRCRGRKPTS